MGSEGGFSDAGQGKVHEGHREQQTAAEKRNRLLVRHGDTFGSRKVRSILANMKLLHP